MGVDDEAWGSSLVLAVADSTISALLAWPAQASVARFCPLLQPQPDKQGHGAPGSR